MVETVTPAVCGNRKRQLVALVLFAVGAITTSAALGAVLGLVGSAIGGAALIVAAALAILGALREAGVLRFPIPQSRRQVPDRWRYELPLPVWATGYGAGLGLGILTYQPVATFWVACAAALALGRPLAGAAAFALYGVGRTLVLLLPARRGADAVRVAERLVARRSTVSRANAVALGACACLLAFAPVAGAEPMALGGGSQMDPSAAATGFAYTQRGPNRVKVVVLPKGGDPSVVYPDAQSPSLTARLLAYEDADGIRVVRWRTGEEVARITGRLEKPALRWPWLAYRKFHGHASRPLELAHAGHERYSLRLRNLETGRVRELAPGKDGVEIGRPSITNGKVAWHVQGSNGSRIMLYDISDRRKTPLFTSRIALFANPAITRSRILWTRDLPSGSTLFVRRLNGERTRVVASVSRPSSDFWFWTTELYEGRAYVTRWNVANGVARILRNRG